jgi:SAM-dependent methyltransferase
VPFWRSVALRSRGPVLELGCGTGRIAISLARAGVSMIGIDRSAPMLTRAARRFAVLRRRSQARRKPRLQLIRGDIRHLPFEPGAFDTVLAPYGILQSLIRDRDLSDTLTAVHGVIAPGGLFGIDLVPDVPNWSEYSNRIQLRGRASGGRHLTLVESVRQDRRRRLTLFEQTYIERRGRDLQEHTFELTFRTLPIPAFTRRLERAGFGIEAVLGDYRGSPWDVRADVWIVLARRL